MASDKIAQFGDLFEANQVFLRCMTFVTRTLGMPSCSFEKGRLTTSCKDESRTEIGHNSGGIAECARQNLARQETERGCYGPV